MQRINYNNGIRGKYQYTVDWLRVANTSAFIGATLWTILLLLIGHDDAERVVSITTGIAAMYIMNISLLRSTADKHLSKEIWPASLLRKRDKK